MKRLSWKYIAGLIDGEGCLDFQHSYHRAHPDRPYIRPRIRVAMATPGISVLESLHVNFGGHFGMRNRSKNPNWSDAYSWELNGKKCRPFLQNLVNHLEIKKEQAKLLIWMIDNVIGKHVPDAAREHLKAEMKAMKRDPQRLSDRAVSEFHKIVNGC